MKPSLQNVSIKKKIYIYLSKSIGLLFSVCAEKCSLVSQPIFNVIFQFHQRVIVAIMRYSANLSFKTLLCLSETPQLKYVY